MNYIENRTFDSIKIGDSASIKRTLTQKDIELFAVMSGDVNPAVVDKDFAKDDIFHKIIAHGMWGGSLISTVLGTELPGPGSIYLEQTLQFKHPVLLGDVITVMVTVTKKNLEKHIVELDCKCTNQHKDVVITGAAIVIAPTEKIKRKRIELPEVVLKRESSSGQWHNTLLELTKGFTPLKVAVVHPDALALEGAAAAADAGLIIPILVGPEKKIIEAAAEAKIDISSYKIVPTQHSHESAYVAINLVKTGEAETLMKGKLHTDELMEAILDKTNGLRTNRRMSHIFSLSTPSYPKPFFLTDAAINIRPTLTIKRDIVQNAIDLFHALGLGGIPKVALVSAIETVTEQIPSTLDATALCKMSERGQITGGILDGPMGFDSAISAESAREKDIFSQVAGDADIIVVPDLESGNLLYKQMTYLSKVEAAGIVMGASVPVILTSRGSDVGSRMASCAMALLYMRNKEKGKK